MTVAEQAALRALLAPAAAPARVGELRGEAAVLAAFRAARPVVPAQSPTVRSRPAFRGRLAKAMSIKAAVAALTVLGLGGVAVAASTGSLPGPLDGPGGKPAKVSPTLQPTVDPSNPGLAGTGPEVPPVVPPGRTVSENTKGAEQSKSVRERNAQRRLEQRERLIAEREERLARQERRRAEQAEKQRDVTERQAQRQAQRQVGTQQEPSAPNGSAAANR